ncbi:MAG: nickel-dependent lactate racemase [Pyrinomonadaceae bacterium]
MNTIHLKYGRGSIPFEYDPDRFQVLSKKSRLAALTDAQIGAALDAPIGSPPLSEIVQAGDSVLLVVSDATRETGSAQIVNLLVRRLIENGVMPGDIKIIFATGTHREVTPAEQRELLTPFIVQRIGTLVHNAFDDAAMIDLGESIDGVPIRVNRALRDFDRVITVGVIGFHYFAGFSGGRKSICPGLAAADTIKATHRLALDFDKLGRREGVGTALLEGNAVNEALERITALVPPAFAVNSIINDDGKVAAVYAGDWRLAHRQACADYLAEHSIQIHEKRDLVVVSSGGWPYDINLIQAHKALEMASYACNEGGTIIWLAECREGLGRPDFLKWFEAKDSHALVERLRDDYEINGQTAWSLMQKTERFRILLKSQLPTDDQTRMRIDSPAVALAELSVIPGFLIPHGAQFLPDLARISHAA